MPKVVTIEEYEATHGRVMAIIETNRKGVEAGEVLLLDDGTLVTKESWDSGRYKPNWMYDAEDAGWRAPGVGR